MVLFERILAPPAPRRSGHALTALESNDARTYRSEPTRTLGSMVPTQPGAYAEFFPSNRELCVCGSGSRFKNCCAAGLRKWFATSSEPPASPEAGSPKAQLRSARLTFSHYWVWHTSHRAWCLSPESYAETLELDVMALSDLLEATLYAAHRVIGTDAFLQDLERLRSAVDDPRWAERIAFLRALARLYPNWDMGRDAALAEFEVIDVSNTRSSDVLGVYYCLAGENLGLASALRMLDRLVEVFDQPGRRLQYRAGRAILLELHGDGVGARQELQAAILEYELSSGAEDGYGHMQYGNALVHVLRLGIPGIADPLEKAVEAFRRVAEAVQLNPAGRAANLGDLGRAYAAAGEWNDAVHACDRSLYEHYTAGVAILKATALSNAGRAGEARAVLLALDFEGLSQSWRVEHCLALASALREQPLDDGDVAMLQQRMRNLEVTHPAMVSHVRTIQAELDEFQRSRQAREIERLHEELERLRSCPTDASVRSALAAHRAMPPPRQTVALPCAQDVATFLLTATVQACAQLLDQRQLLALNAKSMEDAYTAFIVLLLQQRVEALGWNVGDQSLGGRPGTSSAERGRRDLVFRKDGDAPFGVVEAVRCSSMGATEAASIDEHLARLTERYDLAGGATLLLLTYAEVADFAAFRDKYESHLQARGAGPTSRESWARDGLSRRRIKLLQTKHEVSPERVEVTHILVHLGRT